MKEKIKSDIKLIPLSSETKRILLNHDTTEAEEILLKVILGVLKETGYSGELHCRSLLCDQKGKARRPDFYIPRLLLPIEVDGLTRDSWLCRQNDLGPRDIFYEQLGTLPAFIIPSSWVVSEHKMERFRHELKTFLFEHKASPQKKRMINKRIHDGRIKFAAKYPRIFDSCGTEALTFNSEIHLLECAPIRHFGGIKFNLRGKYKERNLFKKQDLDFSNPEWQKKYVEDLIKRNDENFKLADAKQK